jgi:hypothetical protein
MKGRYDLAPTAAAAKMGNDSKLNANVEHARIE